jgi:hypothetical protein
MSEKNITVEPTVSTEPTLPEIVQELATAAFGTESTITPYKIATIINKAFEVTNTEKRIPTQMMYNYDRNGLIVKGKKGVKAYTKDEVQTYVVKYTSKYISE